LVYDNNPYPLTHFVLLNHCYVFAKNLFSFCFYFVKPAQNAKESPVSVSGYCLTIIAKLVK
jgi:hypothetical protein